VPNLTLRITGVEPAEWGIVPLLHFKLALENVPETESIHSVIIQAQIQIQSPRRRYNDAEKERLSELFGPPEQWGQTLRNRLWTHAQVSVSSFAGHAEAILSVQCTYDLNVSSAKYFHALDGGDVSLLFLFSGTIFYAAADGRLQVQPIPWDRECEFRMPAATWRGLMEHHYPKSGFLSLHADVFERLYAYKREHGLATWEQTIARLLGDDDASLNGLGGKALATKS
jgi:hypothetical protein